MNRNRLIQTWRIFPWLSLALTMPVGCGRPPGDPSSAASNPANSATPLLEPIAKRLGPGLYLLGNQFPSASYVVQTPEGYVLIDTGLKGDAGPVRVQLKQLGLNERRLKAILLTHAHGDHSGGAESLRKATGATVYAGKEEAKPLREGQPAEAFFSTFYMPDAEIHPVAVDVELDGDQEFTVGDAHFRAIATPGHTSGSVCYLMERNGQRILFSGDVIMSLRGDERMSDPTLREPLGTYAAHRAPRYRGDAVRFLATLQKLKGLPAPDLVLPGHPRMDPTPQNPAMTQARWQEIMDRGIQDMQALIERNQTDGANFLDGNPKELLPGLEYLGDFQGRAVYGLFVDSRFFLFDAPGGPGLTGFVIERLKALGREAIEPTAVLLTSVDPDATAGLTDLLEHGNPQVVAPAEGIHVLQTTYPTAKQIVSLKDLPTQGWFEVEAIPMAGAGKYPVAYKLPWAGKTVVISGRMPAKPDFPSMSSLFADLKRSADGTFWYQTTLEKLDPLKPDLWLPAFPSNSQNANLYGEEWKGIIARNREAAKRGKYP